MEDYEVCTAADGQEPSSQAAPLRRISSHGASGGLDGLEAARHPRSARKRRHVRIVDQDTLTSILRRRRWGCDSRHDRPFGKWQAHCEPALPSRPVAERTYRAAVHLHERAHQRKADPEAFRTAHLTERTWENISNTCSSACGGIPTPLS